METKKPIELIEFEFVFKSKFYVNKNNYPINWKKKQITDAELESFYDSPKDYIDLLVDEDDYTVSIHSTD